MGKKSIMRMLLTLSISQICYAFIAVMIFGIGTFFLVETGFILSPDVITKNVETVNDILIILSEMEKTVKESTKKQLKQAQLLENSIQSLTHDIQTPATVVSGNLELLEETNMDIKQKEYVKYAQDGISKISEYVEELKTLAKLEQPKTKYVHFNEKYVDNLISLAIKLYLLLIAE